MLLWRHLAEIFISIKTISHASFIILVHQIVMLTPSIATKLTFIKIHHLIRLRFERSEHKKSQCVGGLQFHYKMKKGHFNFKILAFYIIKWQKCLNIYNNLVISSFSILDALQVGWYVMKSSLRCACEYTFKTRERYACFFNFCIFPLVSVRLWNFKDGGS